MSSKQPPLPPRLQKFCTRPEAKSSLGIAIDEFVHVHHTYQHVYRTYQVDYGKLEKYIECAKQMERTNANLYQDHICRD